MLCLGMRAGYRQDASAEKTLPHVGFIIMFMSGSIKAFSFVFFFKMCIHSSHTLVSSVNKHEVPLRFSLMVLKKTLALVTLCA